MFQKMLLFFSAVLILGCEVPPTRIGADAKSLTKLSEKLRSADNKGEHSEALRLAAELEEEVLSFFKMAKVGDPRRKKGDDALLLAREVRARIARQKNNEKKELIEKNQLEEFTIAYKSAETSKEQIGELVMDFKIASQDVTTDSEGDDSSSYGGSIRGGIRVGGADDDLDFDDEPSTTNESVSTKRDLSKIKKPFSILKMKVRKKAVIFHVLVVAKNNMRIGAIRGNAMGEGGKSAGMILAVYEKSSFEPNWDEITESKGVALGMETHSVGAGEHLELVCVAEKSPNEKVTGAKLELMLTNGQTYRARGSGR